MDWGTEGFHLIDKHNKAIYYFEVVPALAQVTFGALEARAEGNIVVYGTPEKAEFGPLEASATGLVSARITGSAIATFGALEARASGVIRETKFGTPEKVVFGALEASATGIVSEPKFGTPEEVVFGPLEASATGAVIETKFGVAEKVVFGALEARATGIVPHIYKENFDTIVFQMSIEETQENEEVSQVPQEGDYTWESRRWVNSGTTVGGFVEDVWSLPIIVNDPDAIGPTTPQLKIPNTRATGLRGLAVVSWDVQPGLENEKYEVQVSEGSNGPWYELDLSGSGVDWKTGDSGGWSTVSGYSLEHLAIPLTGTPDEPNERTLYYRVRRVDNNGNKSGWSLPVEATVRAIDVADIASGAVNAYKLNPESWKNLEVSHLKAYWPMDDTNGNETPSTLGKFVDVSEHGDTNALVFSSGKEQLAGVTGKNGRGIKIQW